LRRLGAARPDLSLIHLPAGIGATQRNVPDGVGVADGDDEVGARAVGKRGVFSLPMILRGNPGSLRLILAIVSAIVSESDVVEKHHGW
jgi:hypothetical protein